MSKIPLKWILLGSLIYTALIALLFLVLLLPQNMRIRELKIKLQSDSSKPSEIQKGNEVLALKNNLKEAGLFLKSRSSISENSALARILELSQKTGIKILSITAFRTPDAINLAGVNEVTFKVAFTGNYRQIVDFIHLLESDRALLRIDRLILENSEKLRRGEIDITPYTK